MVIDEKSIEVIYDYAKKVYDNSISKPEALNILQKEYELNRTSVDFYINCFISMMEGKKYKRTINEKATKYYLKRILNDYGDEKLKCALTAIKSHLEYYATKGNGKLNSIHKIYEEYMSIIDKQSDFILHYGERKVKQEHREGNRIKVEINKYERNSKAREKCIDYYGFKCTVCGFDFEEAYGNIGKNYIHVHHIQPISYKTKEHVIDPIVDLRPICPNCHAMIHKKDPPFEIEEIRDFLANRLK